MRYAFFILLLYAQDAITQSDFRTLNLFTTQNGLSNNSIYCMVQDSRGFLWLGTKEGLSRFDGYRFKIFFSEKDPSAGLADNYVADIIEYKAGQLLIATSNGLSVLNTFSGNFENDKIKSASLRGGSGISIKSLFKDKSGKIWINHSGELDVLDSNLNYLLRFTDLPWARSLKGILVRAHTMMQDKQQWLWLPGDTTGIHIIDFNAKEIYDSKHNPFNFPFLSTNFTRSLLPDDINNCLWYGPWGSGLMKYDFKTGIKKQILFSEANTGEEQTVNVIMQTSSGRIFCLTDKQFYQINASTHFYKPVNFLDGKSHNLKPEISFYSLFHSNDNQYWLGTSTGLWQLKNEEYFLRKLTIDLKRDTHEQPTNTGVTISPDGKLYLGFETDGLVEIEKNRKDYHIYYLHNIPQANIFRVYADNEGLIWVGTTKGLFHFNPATKKFTKPGLLPVALDTGFIASIYQSSGGNLWVGTRGDLSVWRRKHNSSVFEKIDNDVLKKFSSLGINSRLSEFAEDDKKYIWMISRLGGGIIRYNENKNEWLSMPVKEENRALLAEIGLDYIDIGRNDNLWLVDVLGKGLIEYYYLKDSIVKYTRNDGLPGSIIKSVCSDDKGHLWIATEYGLSLFDKNKRKIISTAYFDQGDESINQRLLYDKFSGSIVSVLGSEVSFFNESTVLSFAAEQPVPLIENVFVNNTKIVSPIEKLKLKPFQKNITIDFTAVHFSNADKIRFAYRLSGADNEWRMADEGRSANYSLLSPGSYSFYLKATDINGNWGEEHKLLSFTIVPWFWQTTWFKITVIAVIGCATFYSFRRRIKGIRREAQMKQKIAETEMMALRAQMNPHFIFNCINSIDALIQNNDKYHANIYLNKFAKLIRNILDSSKQNVVALSKDLETLQLYTDLEQFRTENKFAVNIKAEISLLQEDYKIPPLIIQPYVENAILHGLKNREDNDGLLSISVARHNGHIEFIVEDNGVGREATRSIGRKDTHSYGMQMSQERVKIFNKEEKPSVYITDLQTNGRPAGTRVQILLNIS